MSTWDEHLERFPASLFRAVGVRAEAPPRRLPAPSLRTRLVVLDGLGLGIPWAVLSLAAGPGTAIVAVLVAVFVGLFAARAQDLYLTWVMSMRVVVMDRLLKVVLASTAGTWMAHEFLGLAHPAPIAHAAAALGSFVLLASSREAFDRWLAASRRRGELCRPVFAVGAGADVAGLATFLADHPELGQRLVAWFGPDDGTDVPGHLGDVADGLVARDLPSGLGALVLPNGLAAEDVTAVTRALVSAGVHVHVWSGLAGINYRRLVTVPVGHEPFVHVAPVRESRTRLLAKRVLDVVGACVLLVATLPVTLVAAALIKLHDGGPVLFRQTRVGKDGRDIVVHKLRTMVVDAEALRAELEVDNERSGPLFKLERDPRVTPVGDFLRRSSIDELPQLLDVLRGDLSLVGPRPALPEEVAQFDDELLSRLDVRPGITGLWQVEARDKSSFAAYRRLDLFYVENWTLTLDLVILLDSIPAVLGRMLPGRRPTEVDEQVDGTGQETAPIVLLEEPVGHVRAADVPAGGTRRELQSAEAGR